MAAWPFLLLIPILPAGAIHAETWMGLEVRPESRCSDYNRDRDYPYAQSVEPAIAARKLSIAVRNSVVLGCAAYATYIVPTFIAIANWPAALVPIDILIGAALSLITSTTVAGIALRRPS